VVITAVSLQFYFKSPTMQTDGRIQFNAKNSLHVNLYYKIVTLGVNNIYLTMYCLQEL